MPGLLGSRHHRAALLIISAGLITACPGPAPAPATARATGPSGAAGSKATPRSLPPATRSSTTARPAGGSVAAPSRAPLRAGALKAGVAATQDPLGPWQEVGWGGGESMTYAIRLAAIEGGRGAISVGTPRSRAGRRMLNLRGVTESSPFVSAFRRMREDDVVQIDLSGLLPVQWSSDRTTGSRRRQLLTLYGPPLRQEIQQDGRTIHHPRVIQPPVLEGLSALFLLRSMPLATGMRVSMPRVLGGFTLYEVEVVVHGRDQIVVRDRPQDCLRLDGVARQIDDAGKRIAREPERKFSLWLGTDQTRIPYLVRGDTKLGAAEAVLTGYHPAAAPLKVRVHRLPSPVGR